MNGYAYALMAQSEARRQAKEDALLDKIYLDERKRLGLDQYVQTSNDNYTREELQTIFDSINKTSYMMLDTFRDLTNVIGELDKRVSEVEKKYESLPIQLFCNSEEEANEYNNN